MSQQSRGSSVLSESPSQADVAHEDQGKLGTSTHEQLYVLEDDSRAGSLPNIALYQVFLDRIRQAATESQHHAKAVPLEMECEYDANLERGARGKTPFLPVRPQPVAHHGPVATIFCWYSKRVAQKTFSATYRAASHKLDEVFKDEQLPVINCQELITMLEDFEIVPQLVLRSDIRAIYREVAKNCSLETACAPNSHPPDILFEDFCEILVRVALAATFYDHHNRTLLPEEKVYAMLDKMLLNSGPSWRGTRDLRARLAALERTREESNVKKVGHRWDYVFPKYGNSLQSHLAEEIGKSTISPALLEKLLGIVMRRDKEARAWQLPMWRAFPLAMLDFGNVEFGGFRRQRVILRSRGNHPMKVNAALSSIPFVSCSYTGTLVPPGMPTIVEVFAKPRISGEWLGELVIESSQGLAKHVYRIPVYVRCHAKVLLPNS